MSRCVFDVEFDGGDENHFREAPEEKMERKETETAGIRNRLRIKDGRRWLPMIDTLMDGWI